MSEPSLRVESSELSVPSMFSGVTYHARSESIQAFASLEYFEGCVQDDDDFSTSVFVRTSKGFSEFELRSSIAGLVIVGDHVITISNSRHGHVTVYDAETETIVKCLSFGGKLTSIACNHYGRIAIGSYLDGVTTIKVFKNEEHLIEHKEDFVFSLKARVYSLTFSSNGNLLSGIAFSGQSSIHVWNINRKSAMTPFRFDDFGSGEYYGQRSPSLRFLYDDEIYFVSGSKIMKYVISSASCETVYEHDTSILSFDITDEYLVLGTIDELVFIKDKAVFHRVQHGVREWRSPVISIDENCVTELCGMTSHTISY